VKGRGCPELSYCNGVCLERPSRTTKCTTVSYPQAEFGVQVLSNKKHVYFPLDSHVRWILIRTIHDAVCKGRRNVPSTSSEYFFFRKHPYSYRVTVRFNPKQYFFFHNRTVHSDIIKPSIHPTECTTRSKFTLKCSYVFRLTNRHQGAYCCALLKLRLLK